MNFELTAAEAQYRDRVRDFMDSAVRPRMKDYADQAGAEPR